ncbi:MAG: zinc metalloprotease HtpX [Clostridia bacterium]|nr:zinc metalloprotease HtpX [Clostridia bacterium]
MNTFKTAILMALLTAFLIVIGWAIGGRNMAIIFFIISMGLNLFNYFYSDKVAIKMTRSYPVTQAESPELYAMVENLTQRAGLPMPRLYVTPTEQPNAFATGRNPEHAAIAVTEGIMKMLNRSEIEGVLAHEISHIKNRDILISTIAAAIAGAISMIANMLQWTLLLGGDDEDNGALGLLASLATIILAPIAAMLIQMAISRSREYQADADGARIAGSSQGLANALLKMESVARQYPMNINDSAAHMFIVNPLKRVSVQKLFSTHPSTQDRIARLQAMQF